jgi:hypothetical protein
LHHARLKLAAVAIQEDGSLGGFDSQDSKVELGFIRECDRLD